MATALPPVLLLVRGDQAKLEAWWNRLSQERRVRPLQTAGDHVREDIELALFHDFATSVRPRCSSGAANKRMSRIAIRAPTETSWDAAKLGRETGQARAQA